VETNKNSEMKSDFPKTEIDYKPTKLTYEKIMEILDSGALDFEKAMEINRISNEDHNRRSEVFLKMDLNQLNFQWFALELETLKRSVRKIDERNMKLWFLITFIFGVVVGILIGKT